jgi:hypothetical protein
VPGAVRQRGQAALIILLLVVIGVSALVYTMAGPAKLAIARDNATAAALAQAKDALIGYAAGHSTRPGVLPCPDNDNDGSADAPCGALGVTAVGRLPWKTLGLPDVRDGYGECLWYAVSANFKNSGASGPATLNSDSAGTLVVNDTSGAPVYSGSNSALALVIAPGAALAGQDRTPAGTTVCGGNMTVASYLEGGNQNGAATSTFASGPPTTTFNDSVLAITSDALFNVVNIRVAKEAITALETYRTTNSYYPFANAYGSASPYNCTSELNRGRFPITLPGCGQPAWGAALPAWFSTDNWNLVTHYAMSKACGQLGLPTVLGIDLNAIAIAACDSFGSLSSVLGLINFLLNFIGLASLTDDPVIVTGVSSNVKVLVTVTGRAQAAQAHPCASAGECMEDASNTDGNTTYVKPSRYPTSNDRMALTCASNSPCSVIP